VPFLILISCLSSFFLTFFFHPGRATWGPPDFGRPFFSLTALFTLVFSSQVDPVDDQDFRVSRQFVRLSCRRHRIFVLVKSPLSFRLHPSFFLSCLRWLTHILFSFAFSLPSPGAVLSLVINTGFLPRPFFSSHL